MAASLICGRYVVVRASGSDHSEVFEDAAVVQRDGVIQDVGPHETLRIRHQVDEVLGSPDHVILPGFVIAHHHVGLTPFQLGSPDLPLELSSLVLATRVLPWFASRLGARFVDPYLDTLYSAFEMLESGITTVQHIHGWRGAPASRVREVADQIVRAYLDVGMRVSYSYMLRDQNRLAYEADHEFVRRLPPDLAPAVAAFLAGQTIPLADQIDLFRNLWEAHERNRGDRIRIQLAPGNLHWCSDEALAVLLDCSTRHRVGMHMHLDETAFQRTYARKRTGGTAVEHLDRLGVLGPRLTLGHGVWLTMSDIERIADRRAMVCTNPSQTFDSVAESRR
jgi:5-methylthioadenosine/S-adenosylhomocysteine deaminase